MNYKIRVSNLKPIGHTSLGRATENRDSQVSAGYDRFSYEYRIWIGVSAYGRALRERYGEGDVIGFYSFLEAEVCA